VFPRKTTATPDDALSFCGPPEDREYDIDKVEVSVTWKEDIDLAYDLANQWFKHAEVLVGGPAMGDPGGDFVPGQYVKKGYVMTSRGCPNKCWFCDVPKREGGIRELPVTEGYNLLDSNILACSEGHIRKVFAMLKQQDERPVLTGGLEAARLDDWRVNMLWDIRPKVMYFAYDTPDDLEPLVEAGRKLRVADFTRSHCYCYVLIGFPKDTREEAQKRLLDAWKAGFMPYAMLWQGKERSTDKEWQRFQRTWCRPAATRAHVKSELCDI